MGTPQGRMQAAVARAPGRVPDVLLSWGTAASLTGWRGLGVAALVGNHWCRQRDMGGAAGVCWCLALSAAHPSWCQL